MPSQGVGPVDACEGNDDTDEVEVEVVVPPSDVAPHRLHRRDDDTPRRAVVQRRAHSSEHEDDDEDDDEDDEAAAALDSDAEHSEANYYAWRRRRESELRVRLARQLGVHAAASSSLSAGEAIDDNNNSNNNNDSDATTCDGGADDVAAAAAMLDDLSGVHMLSVLPLLQRRHRAGPPHRTCANEGVAASTGVVDVAVDGVPAPAPPRRQSTVAASTTTTTGVCVMCELSGTLRDDSHSRPSTTTTTTTTVSAHIVATTTVYHNGKGSDDDGGGDNPRPHDNDDGTCVDRNDDDDDDDDDDVLCRCDGCGQLVHRMCVYTAARACAATHTRPLVCCSSYCASKMS